MPPPEVIGQNIWFIIGERGELTEAKAEAVTAEGELCPALPEAFRMFPSDHSASALI